MVVSNTFSLYYRFLNKCINFILKRNNLFAISFFFSSGVLVLLVFRDQIVHVGFGFSEFHLIHTFTGVPVEEGLSSEHSGKLFGDSFEQFLDGGGVTQEAN